ncbi:MAG: hypothetical protein H6Q73_3598 [Firmicutes bacterium]|nr:hypothetical protein [Bacillota bacterium]
MTLEQVKIFLAAAKNMNFTKTAEENYTTQPTISRQIGWLEEEWGIQLFVRRKKELRLTPEGAVMLEKCSRMVELLERGLQEAKEVAKGTTGSVRLGFLEIMDVEKLIMTAIDKMNCYYPNIKIEIEKRSFGELRKRLDSGDLDIIFTLNFEEKYLTDAVIEDYGQLKALFIFSDRHPLFSKEKLNVNDFSNVCFLLPASYDSPGREEELKNIFTRLGLECNEIMFLPNMESLFLNVRAGKGVALLDSSVREIFGKNFRHFELPRDIGTLSLIAAWKKENLNPTIPIFVNSMVPFNE